MPQGQTSIWQEMLAAGRGVFALAIGDRKAPGWFDLTLRGLVGSFIAVLVVNGVTAYLPVLLGLPGAAGSVLRTVGATAILLALQIAFTAIALRQMKRLDGLVPYLVAINWSTFFLAALATVLIFTGMSGEVAIIVLGIVVFVVQINIARLVVTLSALQIALLLVAQLVGFTIGLVVVGLVFPLSPAEIAELTAVQ